MAEADRLERFLTWAQASGARASAADRRRMAGELLALAGASPVTSQHVDALVSSLRSTLAGGQAILCAKTVGDDLVKWQSLEVGPARQPPPAATTVPRASPAIERPPPARHDSVELEFDLGAASATAAASALPPPPPALALEDDLELGLPPALQSLGSFPPNRPQPAMPSAPPLADPGDGLELDLGAPAPPARPPAPEAAVASRPSSSLLESEPPPPLASMELDVSGPAPAPTSVRRPAGLADGFHAPPTGAAPPRTFAPSSSRARERAEARPRRVLLGIALAVGALVAAAVLLKPAFLFPDAERAVQGVLRSKHLGVTVELPAGWKQAGDLDDAEETVKGWDRRVSVFYQGAAVTRFERQVTVMVFRKLGGGAASDDDLRAIGAAQTLDVAQRGRCAPTTLGGHTAQRCTGYVTRFANRYLHLEHSFTLGDRIVIVRSLLAVARPAGAEAPGRDQAEAADRDPEVDAMTAGADAIVASISPLGND